MGHRIGELAEDRIQRLVEERLRAARRGRLQRADGVESIVVARETIDTSDLDLGEGRGDPRG